MVVDDEPAMGHILTKSLGADGFNAIAYTDPVAALAAIPNDQPDVILTDVRMPNLGGRELLGKIRAQYPEIPVLIMSAYGTIEDAVAMLRSGAYNYITKPFQHDHLVHQIELAMSHRQLEQEVLKLAEHADTRTKERLIIGSSDAVNHVRETIRKAAQTDSIVLITGESGVGKELVAREIHRLSARGDRRFVAVNCPAVPAGLIESELFGYERGAFTGADRPKMGLIELSAGGTLFLDEIGELPVELQVKLLRVIQEREIQRVGGLRQIPVDLRIIAATNRNLEEEIKAGRFRTDLYYRLKVIAIRVPPLRERTEDIPALANHFISKMARRLGRPDLKLSDSVMDLLKAHAWPGNIREMENILERMATLSASVILKPEDLPTDFFGGTVSTSAGSRHEGRDIPATWPQDYKEARDQFERSYLRQILQASGGKVAVAARISGISRRHLYEKLEKLGLNKEIVHSPDDTAADF